MQFTLTTILASLLSIAAVSAAPQASTTSAAAPSATGTFYLKTSLIPGHGADNKRFGGLYVSGYHTGAGFNDVSLNVNATDSAFLNGTSLQFNLGSNDPWSMILETETEYTAWQPVVINVGLNPNSYGVFSLNDTGLQYTTSVANPAANEFGGWRVCEWWHGVPQLFWLINYYHDQRPSSCSDVELIPQYL